TAGKADLRGVRHRDTGAASASDVLGRHDHAMGGNEIAVEETGVVDGLGWRHAVTPADLLALQPALRKMGHYLDSEPAPPPIDVHQEGARARVYGVRRKHNGGAAVESAVPALVEIDAVLESPLADLRPVIPNAFMHALKVDIMKPARRANAKTDLRHGGQRRMRVRIHVVDEGRAEQHGLERREPRQRCG